MVARTPPILNFVFRRHEVSPLTALSTERDNPATAGSPRVRHDSLRFDLSEFSMIRSPICLTPILLLPFVVVGCSSEKLNELANKAKQTVSEQADKITDTVKEKTGAATDAAKEQMALAGSCELSLDAPLNTSACYVSFLPQGSGRPSVLQLRSYRDAGQESFPSVLFQAQVKGRAESASFKDKRSPESYSSRRSKTDQFGLVRQEPTST